MKAKKVWSLVLAATMIASMAGCGGSAGSDAKENSDAAQSSTEQPDFRQRCG